MGYLFDLLLLDCHTTFHSGDQKLRRFKFAELTLPACRCRSMHQRSAIACPRSSASTLPHRLHCTPGATIHLPGTSDGGRFHQPQQSANKGSGKDKGFIINLLLIYLLIWIIILLLSLVVNL
jgi:hypothetical protein